MGRMPSPPLIKITRSARRASPDRARRSVNASGRAKLADAASPDLTGLSSCSSEGFAMRLLCTWATMT